MKVPKFDGRMLYRHHINLKDKLQWLIVITTDFDDRHVSVLQSTKITLTKTATFLGVSIHQLFSRLLIFKYNSPRNAVCPVINSQGIPFYVHKNYSGLSVTCTYITQTQHYGDKGTEKNSVFSIASLHAIRCNDAWVLKREYKLVLRWHEKR
jgi:hypothetical protein